MTRKRKVAAKTMEENRDVQISFKGASKNGRSWSTWMSGSRGSQGKRTPKKMDKCV